MLHLKKFNEDITASIDKKYQPTDTNSFGYKLRAAQTDVLNKMDPDPIEVWHMVDDYLLEFREKYGKFTDKYGREREIVFFDDIDVKINIGENYSIASICDWKFAPNEIIQLPQSTIDLSTHGKFDNQFYNWYLKNKNNLNPFYQIVIGFEREYIREDSKEELLVKSKDLTKCVSNMLKRIPYKVEIVELGWINDDEDWKNLPPSFSSLTSITNPWRISLGFTVKSN